MKYYLVKLLTNTKGQDAPTVSVYDTLEKAQVAYHQILASWHNANDVLFAVAEIVNSVGDCYIKEIVDHREQPTPATPETSAE